MPVDPRTNVERNALLYERRKAGALLREIAAEFGISAPRVRQIVINMERSAQRKALNAQREARVAVLMRVPFVPQQVWTPERQYREPDR
jgi:hypothetical protein